MWISHIAERLEKKKKTSRSFLASSCTAASIPFRCRLSSSPHECSLITLKAIHDHTGLYSLCQNAKMIQILVWSSMQLYYLAPDHLKIQGSRISKDKLPCTCFSCSVSSASPHASTHCPPMVHWQEHRVSHFFWSPNCKGAKSSGSGWECTGAMHQPHHTA